MKNQLINILNGLNLIETKGQGVIILAECMSQLAQVIDSIPNEETEEVEEEK